MQVSYRYYPAKSCLVARWQNLKIIFQGCCIADHKWRFVFMNYCYHLDCVKIQQTCWKA